MRRPLFGTLAQLARFRGVDVRNRQLRELSPAAYLVAGGKRFALFELSDGDVAETSNLTNRIPKPAPSHRMTTTTTETTRKRFRTLDAACEQIEKLEGQIVALNAALASKTAALAKAQTPTPPSAPAAQPPAAATPPPAKSTDQMSLRELADAADEASQAGNHARASDFYALYSQRKLNR